MSPSRQKSIWTWPIFGLVVLGAIFFYAQSGRKTPVLYADALGYYSYLPALLLHDNAGRMHETAATLPPSIQGYFETLSQQPRSPNGHAITQYTCGVALMQLPFFAVAHAWALLTGQPAHGYSAPYLAAIRWSSVVYAFLGLLLVYRLLRRVFSPATAATTVAMLAAGTNLWWFGLAQAGMAHPQAFFLVAAVMGLTIRALQKPAWLVFAGLGACLGLLTLMRPTDLVFLLLPLLVGVANLADLALRFSFLAKNRQSVLVGAAAFAAVLFPQLLFWKIYAGQWIYYSYTGQGFDWGQPHVWAGVFGFNNGWLAYSPIMGLAVFGLFLKASRLGVSRINPEGWQDRPAVAWLRVGRWFLPLYVYLTFSWWCYYYMNGFGARPMIHVYPLLAFPLALLLVQAWKAGKFGRMALVCFSGAAVLLSIAFQMQQARGNLFSEQSNAGFALTTVFQNGLCYADLVRADLGVAQPDLKKVSRQQVLALESFSNSAEDSAAKAFHPTTLAGQSDTTLAGQSDTTPAGQSDTTPADGFVLKNSDQFLPVPARTIWSVNGPYNNLWLRCSGRFLAPNVNPDLYTQQLLTLQIRQNDDDQPLHWFGCRINNKLGWSANTNNCQANLFSGKTNVWDEVSFFVPVPAHVQPGMILEVGVWNRAGQPLWVDELKLELWEEAVVTGRASVNGPKTDR